MLSEFGRSLTQIWSEGDACFATPGHKGTLGNIDTTLDTTELPGTDDLRNPTGIIKVAQERAAKVFGAENTHFLVGGSTLGNQAMIASCMMSRRGALLVNRHCHISVVNTCKLLNITPIFIDEPIIPNWEVTDRITPDMVEDALKRHTEIVAVLITSPTYYGICSDVSEIAKVCHNKDIPLLVDQAHGAHLHFNDKLPFDAMKSGADLCTESAHKTLPALTQTAFLHKNKNSRIPPKNVQEALNLFQTTSPSYLFMLSLTECVEIMANSGENRLDWLIGECERFKSKVECLDSDDVTRIVFKGNAEKMRKQGVWAEMFDEFGNVVCIPSICNTKQDFEKLMEGALKCG